MDKITILEWNIHQQGRKSTEIPMNILNYITEDVDVAMLLEINGNSSNIDEFRKRLNDKGYGVYITDYKACPYANDILIAVKENILIMEIRYYNAYNSTKLKNNTRNTIPENLFISVEFNNKSFILAAIRIKDLDGDYKMRHEQMKNFVEWTDKMKIPIIIMGDFNNLRDNTPIEDWNIKILDQTIEGKFNRKTPNNMYSWGVAYDVDDKKYDGYIREDHLLYSTSLNINVDSVNYSWNYLIDNINNCNVGIVDRYGKRKIEINPGFPDHASLKVCLEL